MGMGYTPTGHVPGHMMSLRHLMTRQSHLSLYLNLPSRDTSPRFADFLGKLCMKMGLNLLSCKQDTDNKKKATIDVAHVVVKHQLKENVELDTDRRSVGKADGDNKSTRS